MCWISTLPDHGFELLRHCTGRQGRTQHHQQQDGDRLFNVHGSSSNKKTDMSERSNHSSFDSKWMEEDEVELNRQLPPHIEAHWSSDYRQYYFYDSTTDVTSWECPIGNFKKHSSSNVLSHSSKEENDNCHLNKNGGVTPLNNINCVGSTNKDSGSVGGGSKSSPPPPSSQPNHNINGDVTSSSSRATSSNNPPMGSLLEESEKSENSVQPVTQDNVGKLQTRISQLESQVQSLEQEKKTLSMKRGDEDSESHTPSISPKTPNDPEGLLSENDRLLTFNTVNSESYENSGAVGPLSKFAKHKVYQLPPNLSLQESEFLLETYTKKEVHGLNISSFHDAVVTFFLFFSAFLLYVWFYILYL